MIEKPLQEVSKADLEALVSNKTHEGRTLDYKRDLKLKNDDDKRELSRDVSSFANAAGGDLVFGVEEARDAEGKNLGYPERLVGVTVENFDATKQRIESIIRDNIDPRVPGIGIHRVDGFDNGPVVVVRVPQSWAGPHMLSFANQTHFYSRNNSGKQPLDVREIRSLFLASGELEARVRRLRDERLGRIVSGQTPVRMQADAPKLVVHVVPFSRGEETRLDLVALNKGSMLAPVEYGSGWNSRFNIDGFVVHAGAEGGDQWSYSQAFRDGAFEGVGPIELDHSKTPPALYALYVESVVARAVQRYVTVLRTQGITAPAVVLITLVGVQGARIYHPNGFDLPWHRNAAIDRDVLQLPDVLLEGPAPDIQQVLHPVFDALWQASGWPGSCGYDEAGKWVPQLHRVG